MNKIKLVTTIIGIGMLFFLLYSFILNNYFNSNYPYDTFLCSQIDSFMDFYNVNEFIFTLDPYAPGRDVSYPPFALILAYPFSLCFNYSKYHPTLAREDMLAIISFLLLFSSFSFFLIREIYYTIKGNSKLNNLIFTSILFFTYPVFYLFDRGNYLMLTFIFMYFFIHYYRLNSQKSLYFLSAAIAMKIYPALLILLFLINKQYKNIWKTVLITSCLSIIPMLVFKGNFFSNIVNFLNNLLFFSKGHINEIQNLSWSSSLSGIIKIPIMLFNGGTIPFDLKILYLSLATLLIGIVIFLLKKEARLDRRIIYLLALLILIMPISYDYNLVYLYIPLLLLLKKETTLEHEDYFSIIVIALLFIPKSYGILFHDWIWTVSIQSFLTPTLLLSLIIYPFLKRIKRYSLLQKDINKIASST